MRAFICLVGFMLTVVAGSATAECTSYGCAGYVDQLVYLRLPGTAAKFKEVYSLLLTAQVTGWQVFVRIVEGSNPCMISEVRMSRQ